jgi:hypothetical protein
VIDESETWRPVVGHEGEYEVSDRGRVRSLDRVILRRIGKGLTPDRLVTSNEPGAFLRPGLASHGYPTISIKRQTHCVHKLVLEAFVGPRPDGMQACHKDGNRQNPALVNLRWDTPSGNAVDNLANGTRLQGEEYRTAKLTNSAVIEMRRLRGRLSQKALAEMFGVSPAAVQAVMDGRTWKHVQESAAQ